VLGHARGTVDRAPQVRERVPAAGAALTYGVPPVLGEKPPDAHVVAEDGRRVDAGTRDLGVVREDRLGALQHPRRVPAVERNARRLDEVRERLAGFSHLDSPAG